VHGHENFVHFSPVHITVLHFVLSRVVFVTWVKRFVDDHALKREMREVEDCDICDLSD